MESDARAGASPAGAPEAAPSTPNLFQRVGMVFFAPAKLGEVLRHRSPWFWTLAIIGIVSVVLVFVTPEELLRQAAEASGGRQPEGQEPSVGMMRGFGVTFAVVGLFLFAAITAGVLYLVFNILFGLSDISYKQHLSVVSHAWWISLLHSLIAFPLQVTQGDATLRLGFGLLLAGEPTSFVGFFLQNVTLFGIWACFAIAAIESGLSRGKLSTGKGGTVVLILYLIFAACMGALQGLGASAAAG